MAVRACKAKGSEGKKGEEETATEKQQQPWKHKGAKKHQNNMNLCMSKIAENRECLSTFLKTNAKQASGFTPALN